MSANGTLTAAPATRGFDLDAATRAAAQLLTALGVDLSTPSTVNTPARMARAYAELLSPREFTLTTFPNDTGYDELVLVRGIAFRSVCEHHVLPFFGTVDVGYLPSARLVGLSKLARVVEMVSMRPQVQERLTTHLVEWLDTRLQPRGVGAVVYAEHLCMTLRGAQAPGTRTVTCVLRGALHSDPGHRAEFLSRTHSDRP